MEVERRGQVFEISWCIKYRLELTIFDTSRDGMLDSDEFALAMHLMNIKLDGEYKVIHS